MKKIFIGLALMFMVAGCSGINSNALVNATTDTAFILALQNNPSYKAPVVLALQQTKAFLAGDVTYDALILEITNRFGGKYAVFGNLLIGMLAADTPVFETHLTLFDDYKATIVTKIDRLIMLAGAV